MANAAFSTAVHYLRRNMATQIRLKSSSASVASVNDRLAELDVQQATIRTPFSRAKIGPFFQVQPQLGNQFTEDVTLQNYLKRHLPAQMIAEIFPDLEQFGHRASTDIGVLNRECELNPPRLEHYDAWGKRVDNIVTSAAWKQMKRISAEEGLIAIAYERKYDEWSRLYQLAKMFVYAPSSGVFGCPLAMTDGAAKSIEVIGSGKHDKLDAAFTRLTSRDPDKFWTSGQWMTERKGGSDVALGTETIAVKQSDNTYKLYGYKWFSSATDSDMSLTLARVCDERGNYVEGTRGLSMFYLDVRNADGTLNNIEVQRLKEKLGTRAVPTAELLLDGTKATKVSDEGRGVASIANMLTMTRIHNTLWSAACMRRMVNLARDYSMKRQCFGKTIKDHQLHIKNLANMEIEARAATLFTLDLGRLLGLHDCHKMSPQEQEVFRLLTPIAKLYTARQAMAVVPEGLECFGGMGYLEDTGLPVYLRDCQALPIWEGTTNILSLDVLRAIQKSKGSVLVSFNKEVTRRLSAVKSTANSHLTSSANKVQTDVERNLDFAQKHLDKLELAAREFAYGLARCYMGMLMLEHAAWKDASNEDVLAAVRWCQQDLAPVCQQQVNANYEGQVADTEFNLVYAGYKPTSKM